MSNFLDIAPLGGGLLGTANNQFQASTPDSYTTITGAGYVDDVIEEGIISVFDIVYVTYNFNASPAAQFFQVRQVSDNYNLVPIVVSLPTSSYIGAPALFNAVNGASIISGVLTREAWYVSTKIGNDSNNGNTPYAPFATLAAAHAAASNYDVIHVMEGSIIQEDVTITKELTIIFDCDMAQAAGLWNVRNSTITNQNNLVVVNGAWNNTDKPAFINNGTLRRLNNYIFCSFTSVTTEAVIGGIVDYSGVYFSDSASKTWVTRAGGAAGTALAGYYATGTTYGCTAILNETIQLTPSDSNVYSFIYADSTDAGVDSQIVFNGMGTIVTSSTVPATYNWIYSKNSTTTITGRFIAMHSKQNVGSLGTIVGVYVSNSEPVVVDVLCHYQYSGGNYPLADSSILLGSCNTSSDTACVTGLFLTSTNQAPIPQSGAGFQFSVTNSFGQRFTSGTTTVPLTWWISDATVAQTKNFGVIPNNGGDFEFLTISKLVISCNSYVNVTTPPQISLGVIGPNYTDILPATSLSMLQSGETTIVTIPSTIKLWNVTQPLVANITPGIVSGGGSIAFGYSFDVEMRWHVITS